jgi:hypothetical protein
MQIATIRHLFALGALTVALVGCPIYVPETVSFQTDPRILRGGWTASLTSICESPSGVAVSSDGNRIASAGSLPTVWDRTTSARARPEFPRASNLETLSTVPELHWTATGDLVGLVRDASGSRYGLQRWDGATLKRQFAGDVPLTLGQFVFSADATRLAALSTATSGVEALQLTLHRTDTGAALGSVNLQAPVTTESLFYTEASFVSNDGLRFSALKLERDTAGRWVVKLWVWRTSDGALQRSIAVNLDAPMGDYPLRGIAYAPDGRSAVVLTPTQTLRINTEDGSVTRFASLTDRYAGVNFSPSSSRFAVSTDAEVRVYSSATLQNPIIKPLSVGTRVGKAAWLPDESTLVLPYVQVENLLDAEGFSVPTRCGALSLALQGSASTNYEDNTRERFDGRFNFIASYDSESQYSVSGSAVFPSSGLPEYNLSGTVPVPYSQRLVPMNQPLPPRPIPLTLKKLTGETAWQTSSQGSFVLQPPYSASNPRTAGTLERLEDGRVFTSAASSSSRGPLTCTVRCPRASTSRQGRCIVSLLGLLPVSSNNPASDKPYTTRPMPAQ